jgi:hypothetical protein
MKSTTCILVLVCDELPLADVGTRAERDPLNRYRVGLAGVVLVPLASLGPDPVQSALNSQDLRRSPLVAAAGDIACPPDEPRTARACQHARTARLLAGADRVLALGDNQYDSGSLRGFRQSYGITWGKHKSVTAPVPGNHEYRTADAQGYFSYFGARAGSVGKGYYSFNLGSWHLIALNSGGTAKGNAGSDNVVATAEGSAQNNWLERDLARNSRRCTLAYWHHPFYSAGKYRGGYQYIAGPLWSDLVSARADVVLNGHDHNYQRWAKMGNSGRSPNGIREFVVGTGGRNHYGITATPAGLQYSRGDRFGVLRLRLHAGSYRWSFVAGNGDVLDSGSARCV